MKTKFVLLLFFIQFLTFISYSQDKWQYHNQVNLGCNLTLNYRGAQHFSGYRVFVGLGINGIYKKNLFANYGVSLGLYHKVLGTNLSPLVNDNQVDFTNSFSFGLAWGENLSYYKHLRTINNTGFYNINTNRAYATFLTSNFIINNHSRNQTVGTVAFSAPGFSINYYNDGGPVNGSFGLGDNFDRWWTGGGCVYFHNRKNYNLVELSFDQFTGYSPLLYEITGILGINLPSYNLRKQTGDSIKSELPNFNTGSYNLKIYFTEGLGFDVGIIGDLKSKKGRAYGVQDLIHISANSPLHPNNDVNRITIGGSYNTFKNAKF